MKNFREPSLAELLADPIIDILMNRDGVRRETVLSLVKTMAERLEAPVPRYRRPGFEINDVSPKQSFVTPAKAGV